MILCNKIETSSESEKREKNKVNLENFSTYYERKKKKTKNFLLPKWLNSVLEISSKLYKKNMK